MVVEHLNQLRRDLADVTKQQADNREQICEIFSFQNKINKMLEPVLRNYISSHDVPVQNSSFGDFKTGKVVECVDVPKKMATKPVKVLRVKQKPE